MSTFQRTDLDIWADARNTLDQRPDISATVRVHVDAGIATLTGYVRLALDAAEAEDAVRRVLGVRGVVNHISVAPAPTRPGATLDQEC
jgi:osmotically-inducible protein OsmY